jgi:hypothetical protein
MTETLPTPLVPADADLRDFQFMPIDIVRLFGSEFHARSTDGEWRAGVTLWLKSFHQTPPSSIPDDDTALARLAEFGRDVKAWRKVRAGALYGWVLCSDGRWYHPVVSEKAREAWAKKRFQHSRSKRANEARWGKKANGDGDDDGRSLRSDVAQRRAEQTDNQIDPRGNADGVPEAILEAIPEGREKQSLNDPKGQGQGQGQGQGREKEHPKAPQGAFERFWLAYPEKVGKEAARKAFEKATKLASSEEIMAGIARYIVAKPPDRAWCNPATWLNQQRWLDEPAQVAKPNGPVTPGKFAL